MNIRGNKTTVYMFFSPTVSRLKWLIPRELLLMRNYHRYMLKTKQFPKSQLHSGSKIVWFIREKKKNQPEDSLLGKTRVRICTMWLSQYMYDIMLLKSENRCGEAWGNLLFHRSRTSIEQLHWWQMSDAAKKPNTLEGIKSWRPGWFAVVRSRMGPTRGPLKPRLRVEE